MIGERTKLLFKIWGIGVSLKRKSLRTMDSYCSHVDQCITDPFDVTHNSGVIVPSCELQTMLGLADQRRALSMGDTKSALSALIEFLSWLIASKKSGIDSLTVLSELKQATQYCFLNSYDALFAEFGVGIDAFTTYAMRPDVSFFASPRQAEASWKELREKLLNHGLLFVRSRYPLFRLFYQEVFGNTTVNGDKDGNTAPISALSSATGVTTRAKDSTFRVLVNYKLSHIYARPNNPLMFSGLYNIAFTPSIVDDFTEAVQGFVGIKFRRTFRQFAHDRFGFVYSEFKQFVEDREVHQRIDAFNPQGFSEKSLRDFRQLAHADWSTCFEIPD